MKSIYTLFLLVFFLYSCGKYLYPDRSQFIKDGDSVPEVQLEKYKSVQLRPDQSPDLGVAMAISGGGSRSANFAMGILLGLEKLQLESGGNVLKEVDYFSTVSGGGFAGGAYIGALFEHHLRTPQQQFSLQAAFDRHIREELSYPFTGALVRANFDPTLWFSLKDDGDVLEKTIDDRVLGFKRRKQTRKNISDPDYRDTRSIQLGDVFIDKNSDQEVRFPMHIANGSILGKMIIFPFTPDILEHYQVTGYTHRLKDVKGNMFDYFSVPLSIGIKASGSFPVLISSSTLQSDYHPDRKYLHVIDGAMTDNFGFRTALGILEQDNRATKKVLFLIDSDTEGMAYTFSKKQAAPNSLSVASRLPSSGLDARRAMLADDLNDWKNVFPFSPIIFSYNILIEENEATLPPSFVKKDEQIRLIRLMQNDMTGLSDRDRQILFELMLNIDTKYSITKEEQELLILTGQLLVKMKKEEILEVLASDLFSLYSPAARKPHRCPGHGFAAR